MSSDSSTLPETARFLRACHAQPVDQAPIWMMRQAGRYLPEYRELRAKHSMLEMIHTPELAAEVTLQPINRFGFDAAIIFSDILPPLAGMGLELDFVEGKGPVISNPICTPYQIDMLPTPPSAETMSGTLRAIELVSAELTPRNIPLIGFCGAPFTLASYAIEGGSSKSFIKTKTVMYSEPAAWKRLMDKLVTVQADYLVAQAKAGANALQLFDSWAGIALSQQDYVDYVLPYNKKLIAVVKRQTSIPLINFSTGTGGYLDLVASSGGEVIGVDWRISLRDAWERIGRSRPLMGNLDPVALLAPWRELRYRLEKLLEESADLNGYIFNLGHGILPQTPIDNVQRTIDFIRQVTSQKNEVFQ